MAFFLVTVFLGAALLFQSELILAKYLLPWFGGTPAVWTTCMLFFQVLLTGGYVYAHLLTVRTDERRQRNTHLALLGVSVAMLAAQWGAWAAPILPGASLKPAGADYPVPHLLALLLAGVGLPFFLLSTTSSLLQAWFRRVYAGRNPYRLYALSNLGSLIGLGTYPFLVEPMLSLRRQAGLWMLGYVAFACACAICAIRAARVREPAPTPFPSLAPSPSAQSPRPTRRDRALWLLLSAFPSILLLATTNIISEEIAVVPFLWVLPLALYLLSFILCFHSSRLYYRPVFLLLGLGAAWLLARTMGKPVQDTGIREEIVVYCSALFAACMIGHGELARLKPHPRHLTGYFLTVSVGGAVGGAFVALVAPYCFPALWELHVGYFLCALAMLAAAMRDRRSLLNSEPSWLRWALRAPGLAALLVIPMASLALLNERLPGEFSRDVRSAVKDIGLGRLLPLRNPRRQTVQLRRNFYGILRVEEADRGDPVLHRYVLYHARTVHGYQCAAPAYRGDLTSYYTESSGVGLAIRHHPCRDLDEDFRTVPMRIGVVGLGAGTLAAYGREGDYIRFYEINSAVVDIAAGTDRRFTYLSDCPARVEIALGDARISMERERPQDFDVLALDAFSGDSPPVHLLTCEAFQTYLRHLRDGAILAVHVSNRYLDLEPVVWSIADELGMECVLVECRDGADDGRAWESSWVLLSFEPAVLYDSPIGRAYTVRSEERKRKHLRLWTDDYSNLFDLLKPARSPDKDD